MNSVFIPIAMTVLTYYIVRSHSLSIEELANLENGQYERDAKDEPETQTDLRKFLMKKLRFREILNNGPLSGDGFAPLDFDNSKNHKASKRRNMEDIMTRVRALLSDMKERQVKETMSLPSLRFGRSGLNFHASH